MTPDPTNPHLPAAPSPGALRLQQASVALSRRFLEVGSADELERTLAHAAHVVATELGVPHVGLFEVFDHLGLLQGRAGVLDGELVGADGAALMRLPTGRGSMPGYTLLAEHTIVSHDLLADRRFVALAPTLGVFARSAVNAPVGWGGRPWGVLGVYDVQSRVWSPDEVAFVESVANSLGLLLRSVDLAAERHRAGRLADLATAAGGLGRWSWNADLGEVELDDVARAIFTPGGDHAQVDTDVFRTLVHPDDRVGLLAAVAEALRSGEVLRATFRVIRPDGGEPRRVECLGQVWTRIGGPPRMAGVVADLTGHDDHGAHARLVAEQVARHRAEQAGARLATLSEASALFFQSLDPDVILVSLAEFCVPLLADLCRIDLPDDNGRLRARAVRGGTDTQRAALDALARFCPDDLQSLLERDQRGLADPAGPAGPADATPGTRIHDGIDAAALDVAASSPEHRRLLEDLSPTAVVVTPMVARGRVTGVLTLIDTGEGRRSAEHLALVEELAGRAALALDNSRQFESRSRMLDSLQAALTPPALPDPGLLVFAARYRAADPHAALGGDFYDVIDVGEGGWGAVVGDVCGRGHDAAALTGVVRHTVRAAVANDPRPRQVLRQTNAAVFTQLDEFRFCTATYLHASPSGAGGGGVRVVASGAGHPRPVVVRAAGGAELLECGGVPLGVVADPEVTEAEVDLAPGDAVVLYTDGVTEARNLSGLFGEERLLEVLAAAAGGSAEEIAGALDDAVRAHRAGGDDDLAILVIQAAGTH